MALLNISGVDLPTPSDLKVGIQDIVKAERNTKGDMIKEHIATKGKLELSWSYLSAADLALIFTAVMPNFFSVTYLDPQTNTMRTGTFYSGDRNAGMIDFKNGIARYKDIKFNLIER